MQTEKWRLISHFRPSIFYLPTTRSHRTHAHLVPDMRMTSAHRGSRVVPVASLSNRKALHPDSFHLVRALELCDNIFAKSRQHRIYFDVDGSNGGASAVQRPL